MTVVPVDSSGTLASAAGALSSAARWPTDAAAQISSAAAATPKPKRRCMTAPRTAIRSVEADHVRGGDGFRIGEVGSITRITTLAARQRWESFRQASAPLAPLLREAT